MKTKLNSSMYNEISYRTKNVICLDNGGSYTTYDTLFEECPEILQYKNRYSRKLLTSKTLYTVLALVPHHCGDCNIFVLEHPLTKEVYLCTNAACYLAPVNIWADNVTNSTERRIRNIIDDINKDINSEPVTDFDFIWSTLRLHIRTVEGEVRCKYIPNITKMSTERIRKSIMSFLDACIRVHS